jgi:hypothetical protein
MSISIILGAIVVILIVRLLWRELLEPNFEVVMQATLDPMLRR